MTSNFNYAAWTGIVGAGLQYWKGQGKGYKSLLWKGFAQKAIVSLMASYLQGQGLPLLGSGLDANYIWNGVLGAVSQAVMKEGKTPTTAAEEQILCSLIGHRLAANWSTTFEGLGTLPGFSNVNNFFASASGYTGASIPNPGMGIPSMANGNNAAI